MEAVAEAALRTTSLRPMTYKAELVNGHPSDGLVTFLVRRRYKNAA